jgi:transposase
VAPPQRFAPGLHTDYNAIKAGIRLPWSDIPVEGHISRLKMRRRSIFERVKIGLLGRRFLLAA